MLFMLWGYEWEEGSVGVMDYSMNKIIVSGYGFDGEIKWKGRR